MPQAGWAGSKSHLHGSVPGLVSVSGQSLVPGNAAILTVPLPDEKWLPCDQGKHTPGLGDKSCRVLGDAGKRRLCFINKQCAVNKEIMGPGALARYRALSTSSPSAFMLEQKLEQNHCTAQSESLTKD